MSATEAIAAKGTLLQVGDGATPTEAFTTIAEVKSISWDGVRVEFADATHMESPDGFREKIPTLKEGGAVQFDGNYLSGHATQQGIMTDIVAGTKRNFKIVLPNTDAWAFPGYFETLRVNTPVEGIAQFSSSIMPTGKPTPPS